MQENFDISPPYVTPATKNELDIDIQGHNYYLVTFVKVEHDSFKSFLKTFLLHWKQSQADISFVFLSNLIQTYLYPSISSSTPNKCQVEL